MSICVYGLKVVNRAAICPLSKRPLWFQAEEGVQTQSLIQSCENSIPTKLIIGKETDKMEQWPLTNNFKEMELENALTFNNTYTILQESYTPLLCPVDADKKMHWRGLDSGGAVKVLNQSCPSCATIWDNLANPNAHLC
jgi:hypothetical protein